MAKTKMDYPTHLDEIDQWLLDCFGIVPGACSSTENLRHFTARMIAEALWPRAITWKELCKICETAAGMLGKNINEELMGYYKSPKDFYEQLMETLKK